MVHVADALRKTIAQAIPMLQSITDAEASHKPVPEKWSFKEIIGHLLDSAGNNQQKFVRAMLHSGSDFVPYAQDEWVAVQHYNEASWEELLNIWQYYNQHIAHIMQYVDSNLLQNTIYIGGKGPYTLDFIVTDYVEHMKHHLVEIIPQAEFESNFKMVY
jgi:hypothetical protein